MSQDTNEPLPAAALAEVPAEIAEFYRSHYARLLHFVQAKGRLSGLSEAYLDAEGVVQETFIEALVMWAVIRHPERWIYTVARRKVWRRSRQEWCQDRELRQHLETVHSERSRKNTAHIHAVANDAIKLMGKLLSPKQYSALILMKYLDWTGPETATFLGVAEPTAYVHERRAIEKIRNNGYEHSEGTVVPMRFSPGPKTDTDPTRSGSQERESQLFVEGTRHSSSRRPRRRTTLSVALWALAIIIGIAAGWIYFGRNGLVAGLATLWLLIGVWASRWRCGGARNR